MRLVADAERALSTGDFARVKRLLDPDRSYIARGEMRSRGSQVLSIRAMALVAIAHVRAPDGPDSAGAMTRSDAHQNKGAHDLLTMARLAEAQATFGDATDRGTAKATLEDLAAADLIPEPEQWVALAKLRGEARQAASAEEARAHCLKIAKRKGVCGISQS